MEVSTYLCTRITDFISRMIHKFSHCDAGSGPLVPVPWHLNPLFQGYRFFCPPDLFQSLYGYFVSFTHSPSNSFHIQFARPLFFFIHLDFSSLASSAPKSSNPFSPSLPADQLSDTAQLRRPTSFLPQVLKVGTCSIPIHLLNNL